MGSGSAPSDRLAVLQKMLSTTAGRDQVMGVMQFLPGVLLPVAQKLGHADLVASLESLAGMAGQYRAVTRLSGLVGVVSRGIKKPGSTPESVLGFLTWLNGVLFIPMENYAVLAGGGVVARGTPDKRKAQLGPRCVYFWFWSLVFEQLGHIVTLLKGQGKRDTPEQRKERDATLSKLIQATCWFVMAWGGMPKQGAVQLLENPESSILRPLHILVEKTTINAIDLSPFAKAVCGMVPTAIVVNQMISQ